jgi:putative ABC transport system permease protein
MNISLLLRISLRSLAKHKGRSFLTILGIIIGISAIIATLAIGKGAEEKTKQKILSIGSNYIEIFSGAWLQEGKIRTKKLERFQWLKNRDIKVIKKFIPTIRLISPVFIRKRLVTYKDNNVYAYLKGGNENFLKILDRKLARGIFFNKNHVKQGSRVAVLGAKSAAELFKTSDPIGKTIIIKNIPFTVIGTVKEMENYQGIRDPNLDILLPIKSIKRHVLKRYDQSIGSIIISAPTKEIIPKLVPQIRRIIRYRRKLKEDVPDNFTIVDQSTIMKLAKSAVATIQLLLLIIASISLIVGGIGIMNIMLVSVAERRQEIGIRMALGANSVVILRQFLIEAVALCLIGGIIGISLGILIPYIVAYFTQWSPIVTIKSIFIAFAATSIIGIFFGLYPAQKASKLNPVDALAER